MNEELTSNLQSDLLSGDHPLTEPTHDTLGYSPFAYALAKSITKMSPQEGIVIAINGPWGAGKSTVLNFVKYHLTHDFKDEPVIPIHFNPWWFSGREDLTRLLIGQLRASLGGKDFKAIKNVLADFADLVSKIPDVPGKDVGAIFAKKLRGQPDLVSLKDKIDGMLRSSNKRILVIIDDIDRLVPEEIRDLFRTIKATGNFPNVIYLLAFDTEIVIEALEHTFTHSGHSYLEKIVQVPFSLPLIDKVALRQLFFTRLDQILVGTNNEIFDQNYWTDLYYDALDHFINTPRDVVRLTNVLRATYPDVCNEVNPVDFVAIEVVRVYMPKLYDVVKQNINLLTGAIPDRWGNDDQKHQKPIYESWLKLVPEEDAKSAESLLSKLFPKFGYSFTNIGFGNDWLSDWRRKLRICSPDIFPIYFQFAIRSDIVSNTEMMLLLNITNKFDFNNALLAYAKQMLSHGTSKCRSVLERMEDYTEKDIPISNIPIIVESFFDIGDQLLDDGDHHVMFDIGNDMRMSRVMHQLLRRLEEPRRYEILFKAIQGGLAFYTSVHEVAIYGQEHGKFSKKEPKPEEQCSVSLEHLKHLENLVLNKIKNAAKNGTLLNSYRLVSTLYTWRTWAGSDIDVKAWISNIIESDMGLVDLLKSFGSIVRAQSMGSYAVRNIYRLDPQKVEPFLDPETIIDRVRNIKNTLKLSQDQMKAITQFIHEYDLRREGKDPDRDFDQ